MLTILTIAGFDPSGGAGIIADLRTMHSFGCYGIAAVTSITEQNTEGVRAVNHLSRETVRGQICALLEDFNVAAIKTGMLPTAGIVKEVADAVIRFGKRIVVIDPVIKSSSGHDLIQPDAMESMVDQLFPLAAVVTPNAREAAILAGLPAESTAEESAAVLRSYGASAVIVTGGDKGGLLSSDFLCDEEGELRFSGDRVESDQTHGTGCCFASAISCLLAQGRPLRESIPPAKRYIEQAIRTAPSLGKGKGGLNPFLKIDL